MPQTTDKNLFIDLNVLAVEPAEQYHAKAGEYLSSHLLADFRRCPLLYAQKVAGLIPEEDRPAYLLGTAAHTLILEGREAFQSTFAVGGPINPRTGRSFGSATKAYAEWAAEQGKPAVTEDQVDLIEKLRDGVASNVQAVELIRHGRWEGVVRASYCGVDCQARFDWIHPFEGIVDFKTCDDLTWFEADARRYGYVHQMAFYQAVLAQMLDGLLVPVHIIAVEKKAPFRCGVWRVGDSSLAIAQGDNEAAIERLIRCRKLGVWPTDYEVVRVLEAA